LDYTGERTRQSWYLGHSGNRFELVSRYHLEARKSAKTAHVLAVVTSGGFIDQTWPVASAADGMHAEGKRPVIAGMYSRTPNVPSTTHPRQVNPPSDEDVGTSPKWLCSTGIYMRVKQAPGRDRWAPDRKWSSRGLGG